MHFGFELIHALHNGLRSICQRNVYGQVFPFTSDISSGCIAFAGSIQQVEKNNQNKYEKDSTYADDSFHEVSLVSLL